jgi:preprotein translocase subunit YajC
MPNQMTFLLAQDITPPTLPGQLPSGAATKAPGGPTGQPDTPLGNNMWLMVIGFIVIMFLVMSMGNKKEKRKRETLLNSLKKHDKVKTIGGVIGSVVEVKPDVVIIKVDEASNTRITFDRSAISMILKESPTTSS